MRIDDEITAVKGVGDKVANNLRSLGIKKVSELINFYPRKYQDYSKIEKISDIKPGNICIKAKVTQINGRYSRKGLHITQAALQDDSGNISATWFNQPYLKSSLKKDQSYLFTGEFVFKNSKYFLSNPSYETEKEDNVHSGRIIPIYRESKNLKSKTIRSIIFNAFKDLAPTNDILPSDVISKYGLEKRHRSLELIHFPREIRDVELSRKTIGFEELFTLMLANKLNEKENLQYNAYELSFYEKETKEFVEDLPFKLTTSQKKVAWEIIKDIQQNKPMNRLVEGDVGSGKTIVSTLAVLQSLLNKKQTIYLAPTETLAKQQFEFFKSKFTDKAVLLTGSLTKKQKNEIKKRIEESSELVIVGTHALLEDDIEFNQLALAIIDEQHRFGVKQREKLRSKQKNTPHMLSMTATPIPRSLALTVYGELTLSIIEGLPEGRKKIDTKVFEFKKRQQLQRQMQSELKKGNQIYVVTPLIEESETLTVKDAENEYKRLKNLFKDYNVGLLHGKLNNEQKTNIYDDFINKKIDILVSTTVIEVGIDNPNATMMIIEGAERFGLAQLHQLRGRVGRSEKQSFCFLVSSADSAPSERLKYLEQIDNGFELADIDLELRGPGEIYGLRQHGALDLRMANITDYKLIKQVSDAVNDFIETDKNLLDYPELYDIVSSQRSILTLN